jgi:hypothetical protein
MKRKANNIENDNPFLNELFTHFEPDKGSYEIKRKTMDRVLQDWAENPVVINPVINKYNRLWVTLGIMALVVITYMYDMSEFEGFGHFMMSFFGFLSFSSLKELFATSFSFLGEIPQVVVLLVIGMTALLGLDRLLNRLANI